MKKKSHVQGVRTYFDYNSIDRLNEFLVSELKHFQTETNPETACDTLLTRALLGLWISHRLLGGGGAFERPPP